MIKVKLTRLESNHNNLRTDTVEGETEDLPTVGQLFLMFGKGLEFGTRMVHTTKVQEILNTGENVMEFKTRNSRYKLEIIKEENGPV